MERGERGTGKSADAGYLAFSQLSLVSGFVLVVGTSTGALSTQMRCMGWILLSLGVVICAVDEWMSMYEQFEIKTRSMDCQAFASDEKWKKGARILGSVRFSLPSPGLRWKVCQNECDTSENWKTFTDELEERGRVPEEKGRSEKELYRLPEEISKAESLIGNVSGRDARTTDVLALHARSLVFEANEPVVFLSPTSAAVSMTVDLIDSDLISPDFDRNHSSKEMGRPRTWIQTQATTAKSFAAKIAPLWLHVAAARRYFLASNLQIVFLSSPRFRGSTYRL
ncbi:hypothetical protein SCHPADRAFT_925572 [Schizopora paradoxa]|uniref:Uncharacterized protein n=1 Tax=Schizopora paradoxa TaxID=27342 RepID=A0A0H2S1Y6_9AGAM|nr:hypothetical protein SCHPADRAFT_925572 [Schizopora paradoxa]